MEGFFYIRHWIDQLTIFANHFNFKAYMSSKSFHFFILTALSISFFIQSCEVKKEIADVNTTAVEKLRTEEGIISPIWVSNEFVGTHDRALSAKKLIVRLKQDSGGFDTSIAREDAKGVFVDEIRDDLQVGYRINVTGTSEGDWWAGPKISVNWNNEVKEETFGWYENYIIDTASWTPEGLVDWLYQIHHADSLGTTVHDGETYQHFLVRHKEWFQFWAVRSKFRSQGQTSIKPILNFWRAKGLPNKNFDGVKLNIETNKKNDLEIIIDEFSLPSNLTK